MGAYLLLASVVVIALAFVKMYLDGRPRSHPDKDSVSSYIPFTQDLSAFDVGQNKTEIKPSVLYSLPQVASTVIFVTLLLFVAATFIFKAAPSLTFLIEIGIFPGLVIIAPLLIYYDLATSYIISDRLIAMRTMNKPSGNVVGSWGYFVISREHVKDVVIAKGITDRILGSARAYLVLDIDSPAMQGASGILNRSAGSPPECVSGISLEQANRIRAMFTNK